jgi:cysteine desulfurase
VLKPEQPNQAWEIVVNHVIKAMGYGDDEANEAIRLSWCHLTPEVDWAAVARRIRNLR